MGHQKAMRLSALAALRPPDPQPRLCSWTPLGALVSTVSASSEGLHDRVVHKLPFVVDVCCCS